MKKIISLLIIFVFIILLFPSSSKAACTVIAGTGKCSTGCVPDGGGKCKPETPKTPTRTDQRDTASSVAEHLNASGGKTGAGYGEVKDPRNIAMGVIKTLLNFLAILFLILTIYAGFLWMTAGGAEDRIEKAKKLLFRSVMGLLIILSAYSITWAIVKIALNYSDDPTAPGFKTLPSYRTY
jgi:hypothetical protein